MGDRIMDELFRKLRKGMALDYQHNWIVDNMPVTFCYSFTSDNDRQYCTTSFPMGCYVRSIVSRSYI